MSKSATDLMQEIILSAFIDSVLALKAASKGLPNTLLRDLNAIHGNTTLQDLPREVQQAIANGVRGGFNRLMKEGYSISSAAAPPRPPSAPRDDRPRRGPPKSAPGGRPVRPGPRRPSGKPGPRPPKPS